jgi:Cu/Ag efflux pump CusA
VSVALTVLLLNARAVFIALLAIAFSLLAGVALLCASGATLNVLTLGGIVLALGEVIDDAINGVESVFRRLRENQQGGAPRSKREVVLRAAEEIRNAVAPATFVGRWSSFRIAQGRGGNSAPIEVAYPLTALASLMVALTPHAGSLLRARGGGGRPAAYMRWPGRRTSRAGAVALRPGPIIAVAAVVSPSRPAWSS